jgi:hypothetical protein
MSNFSCKEAGLILLWISLLTKKRFGLRSDKFNKINNSPPVILGESAQSGHWKGLVILAGDLM